MADVVVIGGGLTGLAAAWELERLGVSYSLIEVKPRLGGSIMTERRDGFILDGGSFVLEKYADWAFLAELGLDDALESIGKYRDGQLVIFKDGTQTLTDALAGKITQPVLTRMAVSSVGQVDGKYAVCLENGLMMETHGLVISAPARYTSHMLYSLQPEAAALLLDYQYDPVVRISLGYRLEAVTDASDLPNGAGFKFVSRHENPSRVPEGHVLIRVGMRLGDPATASLAASRASEQKTGSPLDGLIGTASEIVSSWGYGKPVMTHAAFWPESDPQTRHLPEFSDVMDRIDGLLPPGVTLVGSDYRAKWLDQQVEQGRAAARAVISSLQ